MARAVSDDTTTQDDGSTVQTVVYADGSQSITYTPGPSTPAANQSTLQQMAQSALSTNRAYINLANPTAAQTVAEVKKLAQQQNALIRLVLNQLDATT